MKDGSQLKVAVLSADPKDVEDLRHIIEDGPYRLSVYPDVVQLKAGLKMEAYIAAILDVDSVSLDNRTIRLLTLDNPGVCFFCTSRDRFHPNLKDAICYHLFACLQKPVDPDELHYFLKCIRDNEMDSRGPPAR